MPVSPGALSFDMVLTKEATSVLEKGDSSLLLVSSEIFWVWMSSMKSTRSWKSSLHSWCANRLL